MMDISAAESGVCEFLTTLLRSHAVGESIVPLRDDGYPFLPLEHFLPEVLREVHPEWQAECLDGIYPWILRKTGVREIELVGLALFLSDQTLTALRLNLQLSPGLDCVSWIDLRLGERINGKCHRVPYGSSIGFEKMVHVDNQLDAVDWFYHVSYGDREMPATES